MEYLTIKGFIEMERINGTMYVIIKHVDTDLYRYRILRIENNIPVWTGYRCDKITEARNELKRLRMDARDARIQAMRNNLKQRDIEYRDASYSMKDIIDAYNESIEWA